MILVDTSVWIDHLHRGKSSLTALLEGNQVLTHPFVIGEIAMGNLKPRDRILADLQNLPQAVVALNDEVLDFVESKSLYGLGIGYVDCHLLASLQLSSHNYLWTNDKRLHLAAQALNLAFEI